MLLAVAIEKSDSYNELDGVDAESFSKLSFVQQKGRSIPLSRVRVRSSMCGQNLALIA